MELLDEWFWTGCKSNSETRAENFAQGIKAQNALFDVEREKADRMFVLKSQKEVRIIFQDEKVILACNAIDFPLAVIGYGGSAWILASRNCVHNFGKARIAMVPILKQICETFWDDAIGIGGHFDEDSIIVGFD